MVKRQRDKENRGSVRLALLATALLGAGVFTGSGFGTVPVTVDSLCRNQSLQIAKSPLIDQVVRSLERQARAQNTAPRRQTPGAIPAGGLDLARVFAERSLVEAPFCSLAIVSRPNDRAPPHLAA
ncbi:MAG TPA: hypothetical protein VLM38_05740 [Blastocatellia bacterium]|nr:hypothetical protein [Blastocatellia bacterium]